MTDGARTPEEVDGLLEDALVLGDHAGLTALFDDRAVLVGAGTEARGAQAIAEVLTANGYVASNARVVRAGDAALVVADGGVHVVRRDRRGAWRAAISLLHVDNPEVSEEP